MRSKQYTVFTAAASIILLLFLMRFPGVLQNDEAAEIYTFEAPVATLQSNTQPTGDILQDLNNALVNIVERANPTVVTVNTKATVQVRQQNPFDMFDFGPFRDFFGQPNQNRSREREMRGMGSGVIVSDDGIIITNNHVIQRADTITVRLINGDELPAEVLGTDPQTDVAILKVNAQNLPYMAFGNSDELRVGEMVLAIGSPLQQNLAHTVTKGIVSAKGRSQMNILGPGGFEDFIQTDAAINRGNSGGPLINMRGELIGINTAIASQTGGFQGIGFSIPSNMVNNVKESILETGTVVRGFLGIFLDEVSDELARAFELGDKRGILVNQVQENSPAEKGGILEGDIILELNDRQVRNVNDFRNQIANTRPGTELRMKVYRDGNTIDKRVTIGELKPDTVAMADDAELREVIGFDITELTSDLARQLRLSPNQRGVVVEGINETSPAYRNGLRQGDVIIAVNRQAVGNPSDFRQQIDAVPNGEMVLLQVVRRNQRFFVAFEMPT